MKYAVDSKGMKQIDNYTVEVLKIPAVVLMERAALEVTNVMKQRIQKSDRILVVCGQGNNGGDGIAAGRILYLQGYDVAILFIGEEEKATPQTKMQLEVAGKLGIPIENCDKLHEYNIIIDSVFGVGLSRPVTGIHEQVINRINGHTNIVYAVDIPSGISADSGKVMNAAVRADYTITFGYQKLGILLYPGADYAGNVIVADIGFPDKAVDTLKPPYFYYTKEDLYRLPVRENYSHKGTFGKVLIIAGSKGMSGAAFLSAKASYRTGAGLVKILTSESNRVILQSSLPEALFSSYEEGYSQLESEKEIQQKLQQELKWATVVVIGPGLGQSDYAKRIVDFIINNIKVPLIIDADAITLISKQLDLANSDPDYRSNLLSMKLPPNTILTPHVKEASRLMGISVTDITNNMIDTAMRCSYNNELIFVIKDARTIVSRKNECYLNNSGNHGMATGGSGDVLTGILAGLIAQGMEPYKAACLAVYIHGLAGDTAAEGKGAYSMMAGDIIDSLEQVLSLKVT